jgi:U3 small nucleolar RNA-associated protein 20
MHGRVNEALQRVVAGLSVNPSLKAEEVLLYVYGLISPFVLSEDEDEDESGGLDGQEPEAEGSESDVDEEDDLQVIGKAAVKATEAPKPDLHRPKKEVSSWLPVDGTLKLAVEAKQVQRMAAREEIRVLDGKNAPKLTGWGRHGAKARRAEGGMFGSPAALAAGVLGLRLLHSYLKRLGQPSEELIPVLDPYVGLLARCVRRRVNDSIVLLSLKCLALMLRHLSSLPSLTYLTPRLVRSSLSLLSMAGGPANSRDEIVQSCLRILTILIAASGKSIEDDEPLGPLGLPQPEKQPSLPIPAKSLGALVCLLRAAALDYDHVNAPFALVRALVARRAMVPEMYDLMEQMLGIAVTSRRPTVRQMGGQIIVSFLLHYPLSSVKVAGFLQQAVRNLDYEYAEGRMAALGLLQTLIMKLQVSMVNEHAQVVFFPMVLRLVNDPCPKTRAAAAEAISALLRRVSGDVFNTLLDYQCRWMQMRVENEGLARAAAQAVGLFVDSRPDLFKRGGEDGLGMELLVLFSDTLASVEKRGPVPDVQADGLESPHEREGEAALGWEMAYHCLGTINRIYARLPGMVESFLHGFPEGMTILSATSEILCYRHAWVRLAASRVIGQYLDRRATGGKTRTLITGTQLRSSPFLSDPAHCAALARRLCVQIDRPSVAPELSLRAVKSLVFLTSAMVHIELELERGGGSPVRADAALEGEEEDVGGGESEVGVQEKVDAPKDLLSWIFHRLSYMARRRGEDRRCAVFQFFAAVTTLESQAVVERFLPHMLSPLYRATSDGQAEASAHGNDAVELAKEVTALIEEKAGATAFLKAFSDVQKQATQKRASRKQARAVEAITDPGAAAQRKLAKNVMKRETIKRKKGKYREIRGGAPPGERASKRQRSVGEGNKDEGM